LILSVMRFMTADSREDLESFILGVTFGMLMETMGMLLTTEEVLLSQKRNFLRQ